MIRTHSDGYVFRVSGGKRVEGGKAKRGERTADMVEVCWRTSSLTSFYLLLMHPPLHKPSTLTGSFLFLPSLSSLLQSAKPLHLDSACEDVIKALEECHTTWKKWWGGCNDQKIDVTLCLRAEVRPTGLLIPFL